MFIIQNAQADAAGKFWFASHLLLYRLRLVSDAVLSAVWVGNRSSPKQVVRPTFQGAQRGSASEKQETNTEQDREQGKLQTGERELTTRSKFNH